MYKATYPDKTALTICLRSILAPYPVTLAYLYGSAAAGKMTPLSDVDIALVIAHEDFIPSERLRLELAIEDKVVQTCKLKQADIRIINDAPLVLQGQGVTNGTLLFAANNEAKVSFETYVRSRYLDFLPVATLHRQAFFADIRRRGIDGQRSQS